MSENLNDEPVVVFITARDRSEASRLAEMLVGARFAACVQILPEMQSVYRWQGEVHRSSEVLLLAKTVTSRFAELERQVRALHSYETPEVLAVPASCCSTAYERWIVETIVGAEASRTITATTTTAAAHQ
ncbi:MAG: divalent-cation tolerance protein CutA [Pyrinomonadaceae bacterium]